METKEIEGRLNKLKLIGINIELEVRNGKFIGNIKEVDKNIKTLVIPDGIQIIQNRDASFYIDKVKLPETIEEIAPGTFNGVLESQIGSINLPKSLKIIGSYGLYSSDKLEIHGGFENLEYIGTRAFGEISTEGPIILGSELKELGKEVFTASKIESIDMSRCKIEILPDRLFYRCKNLVSVKLPDCIKSLGDECFRRCEKLMKINIPKELGIVGRHAFMGCKSIGCLDFSDSKLRECLEGAFENTNNMFVVFPQRLRERMKYTKKQ